MALATWWYEDGQPPATGMEGLSVECPVDDTEFASVTGLDDDAVAARRAAGHRPYLARIDGEPASYGWVATVSSSIGELELTFDLPAGNRYLWDFATLPRFRGRGIYPQLLGEIIRRECPPATRLWIIHAPENLPSGVGISRAGFEAVGELSLDRDGRPAFVPVTQGERAIAAAELLGVPLGDGQLDACWVCGGCSCDRVGETDVPCRCAILPSRGGSDEVLS